MAILEPDGAVVYEADRDNEHHFSKGNSILEGAGVTAQASPNLSVKVASGTARYGGAIRTIAAVDPLTVSAADPTNPRVDLVEVDGTTGVATIKAGTPAATPKPPVLTSGRLLLAFVSVAAAAANVQASNISERRFIGPDAMVAGLLAARPTAAVGGVGGTYFATDTNGGTLYRSNGTSWAQVAQGVTEIVPAVPACRVYKAAAFATTSGAADAAVPFDTERFDTDTMHDNVTNNTRITFTTAGKYQVSAGYHFAASAGGTYRVGYIRLNGTTSIAYRQTGPSGVVIPLRETLSTLYQFAANDYVELMVAQDSGGALDIGILTNSAPEFMAFRVSA